MMTKRRAVRAPRRPRPAAPFRCRLVIMVREPVAGRVKTRLAKAVGVAEAVRFYRSTQRAVIARLSGRAFWETILAVAPDRATGSRVWPRCVTAIGQGGGDLGTRMQRPMRNLPPGPVCVVGTDIPGIEPRHIRRAFRLLGATGVVLGPAADGGFWLIGMRRRPRVKWPYAGVRWSTNGTRAAVEANFGPGELGHAELLHDVDDPADLARERGQFGRLIRPR